jgi:hypothetical protein
MNVIRKLDPADRLIGASMLVTIGGIVLGAVLAEPRAFGIDALVVMALLIAGTFAIRSPRLAWLLPFGLVVGVSELWADWVHVAHFGSLVYTDTFGFRLLASPSYMPVGWWLTSVQFGYLALRLADRWPRWRAVALVVVLGMTLPPWYEELAAPAQAWHYTTTGPMLSNTPVWIILTYGGCMAAIGVAALIFYRPRGWGRALLAGAFAGAGIMFSGVFWFSLLG